MPNSSQQTLTKQNLRAKTELAKVMSRKPGGYRYFINNVFAACFGDKFIKGEYLNKVADHLEYHKYTMDVTGRDHFKSTRLYVDIMYSLFVDEGVGWEAHYFSYNKTLASYHMAKLKEYVKNNPFFVDLRDDSSAKSVLMYHWDKGREMTVTPQGLLSGKRGIHADKIYVDDPFKNEEEEADRTDPIQIRKINDVILSELLQMVNVGGTCRCVGTPQSPGDFFFNAKLQKVFDTWITPSIVDEKNKISLWPEHWSFERLIDRRDLIGEAKFNREFMAMPVTSSNSYIHKDDLLPLLTKTNWEVKEQSILQEFYVVGGFDIGKKRHPSHLALFIRRGTGKEIRGIEQYEYEQILSFWMDKWDYSKQMEWLNMVCEYFNVSRLRYDNTRSEFESYAERGELHEAMIPQVLSHTMNFKLASNFGKHVEEETVHLVNEQRQYNQILQVNGDVKAIETPEGHGDSFFSVALALYEGENKVVRIRNLQDQDDVEEDNDWDDDWAKAGPRG
jgi:hypothetical protein